MTTESPPVTAPDRAAVDTPSGDGAGTTTPAGPLARAVAPDGLVAGRYRLDARIGAGGMATIFRARDTVLERDVAVKVVHAHLAGDGALIARFRDEARHAAALDHPNVVHVYDAGVEDLPYIVMEYVDGPSLRQVLTRHARLSPGQVRTVLEPVAYALARAHERGLVHRDVKPENILIAADGTPKIADFGIARTMAASGHTSTGQLIGSVHYMAPEIVDGADPGATGDQYALGVVAFELLTGRKALPAHTPAAVALRHAREDVPALRSIVSDVPRKLERVVATATSRDPAGRFTDLGAFAGALAAAVPTALPLPTASADTGGDTLVVDREALETAEVAALDDVHSRADGDADDTRHVTPSPGPAAPGLRDRAAARWRRLRRRVGGVPARLSRPAARAVIIGLLVVAVLAGAGAASWHFLIAPVRAVPELAGVPQTQAEATLADLGLSLEVTGSAHDLRVPEGAVLTQEPAAGASLRSGGTVDVVVSLGLDEVAVPDVTGLDAQEAAAALAERDLGDLVVGDEAWSDEVPAGDIISQEPAAEEVVEQLSDVTVVVSRGVEQVTVPDVSGRAVEEARTLLEDAKLAVDVTEQYSDDVPTEGEVISQGVGAGDEVDKGTTVDLVVSRGPLTIPVPDVRTQPLDEAVARLEGLGLDVEIDEDPVPTLGPFRRGVAGRAEETLPQAGESVQRGDRVLVYTFVD